MYGVISCRSLSLIMRTGGAERPFRHDRHFRDASSFQIGVSRGRRMASSGKLARVLQRLHSTSSQPSPRGDQPPVPSREQVRRQSAGNAGRVSRLSAPVVRNAGADRELTMMRWGMQAPPRLVDTLLPTSATPGRVTGGVGSIRRVDVRRTAFRNTHLSLTRRRAEKMWCGSRLMTIGRCSHSPVSGPNTSATVAPSQSDIRTAQRLWLPDDSAQRGGRADTPEGNAGDPDNG